MSSPDIDYTKTRARRVRPHPIPRRTGRRVPDRCALLPFPSCRVTTGRARRRFPYPKNPPKFDHSKTAGGYRLKHIDTCLGCQNRLKYLDQLAVDEKARGVAYKNEKERLAQLPVSEQDRIFWAKFGMTGPPKRSTPVPGSA